ncbi:unannotated protein [freshwater metagenome]|uniref:Unannotated protein n=1 Tax=freshwater metagenome TaxID=449393 RepID=A0A6J7PT57_9ZZZZ
MKVARSRSSTRTGNGLVGSGPLWHRVEDRVCDAIGRILRPDELRGTHS